jgi:uncharacterized protein
LRHRLIAAALGLSLGACASDPMIPVRAAYSAGEYESARDQLEALRKSDSDNAHLYGLELAVVQQALANPKAAVAVMRKARDTMDRLAEGNYTDWAASAFLDDRSTTYPGADYEHVLVRAMLALADLMSGGNDAFAYALQVRAKQQQIIESFDSEDGDNPKLAYKLVAFGNYLRAIISEQDARDRSEARREFERVRKFAPDFVHGEADLERVTNGRFAEKGNGVVHVLALVGRGPLRVELREKPTAAAIGIAQILISKKNKQFPTPTFVPIPIPGLEFHQDNPEAVVVSAGGKRVGETAVLTDVEAMAQAEFRAMKPYVLARAVVRRLIKVAVVEGGKAAVQHNRKNKSDAMETAKTDLLEIGIGVLGNLWAATEAADLRCWNLLPASFQVLRIELPEGVHDIAVQPIQGGRLTGQERHVRVRVIAGYNTYVAAIVPTREGGPAPMTSRPIQ